ncbi:PDDEXK-like family protein [Salinimicrobium sediminilitoris]|uniref:PDDEXK-like family protein n=1 Tax=Salinimicrobium sediminilitoris TaxID=2876715 RepID=UPI001E34CC04|nr:PD-(D/E)XK nuclease family protein [Salinimicrobium sediminilitoris]MCC8360654.1 PD-(D/E)XK nuclease family protein [Salinimicrobium sediminilitoris]
MSQPTIKKQKLKHLLQNTKRIVDHHEKITVAKGEHFNLFSVLGIESRENKTHSAFLAELLDPKGSHKQENKFLNLFLQVVGKELPGENAVEDLTAKYINTTNTCVITEYSIGKRNDKNKEGGRLDILIRNGNDCICIENKIYALDQKAQIERYSNYNSESNKVFYLTLKGGDPHQDSKGELESGEHFFNISYRKHIVEWLELCLREVPNLTSVREAINQYILLIKKLTNTLHMEQEKELQNLMATYLEESRYIARKYETMIEDFQAKFRKDVEERLRQELSGFEIEYGKQAIGNKYSKLWIFRKEWRDSGLRFGIEPFSGKGHGNGYLFVGLFNKHDSKIIDHIPDNKRLSRWWKHTQPLLTNDENRIKLRDVFSLQKLSKPESSEYKELVDLVANQSRNFIIDYAEKVSASVLKENHKKLQTAE